MHHDSEARDLLAATLERHAITCDAPGAVVETNGENRDQSGSAPRYDVTARDAIATELSHSSETGDAPGAEMNDEVESSDVRAAAVNHSGEPHDSCSAP